jgi:hypothetical protein
MDMFALDDALPTGRQPCPPCAALRACRCCCRWPGTCASAIPRALQLAAEGLALLADAALPSADAQAIAARFLLVQAEAAWLAGQLELADEQAADAGERFASSTTRSAAPTPTGCAPGSPSTAATTRAAAELEQMAAAAREAGDTSARHRRCRHARWCVLHDLPAAQQRWGQRFSAERKPAGGGQLDLRLLRPGRQPASDFGAAAAHLRCYEAALETGQLRMAITAAINIGLDFTLLNDHHAALEWMESALDLARPPAGRAASAPA